jgi:serine/threonine protein kinase
MGEVYKACDTRLDRIVALKVCKTEFSERFEREARAVAALNHSNICTLHDVGPNYLVMEYIEGTPLKGPLPLDQALKYAVQICDALDAAHKKGITHRDLKPANILVIKSGIKLLDFGLAKVEHSKPLQDVTETIGITKEGAVLGTLQYMSPEQLHGREADARSDIFSFGLIFYEMLTGKRAFEGQSQASLISAILRDEPAALNGLVPLAPPSLQRVVSKCIAKHPDDRWQNAADLADEVRWIATLSPQAARVTLPLNVRISKLQAIVALLLLLLTGGVASHWLWPSTTQEAPVPRYLTYSGRDSSPAVSPDRKLIAFTSDRDGHSRIWLKQLASGNEFALTAGPDDFARFSTDGSMVLFSRNEGSRTSLFRAATFGGDMRKVLTDVVSADFSPDAQHIGFVRWKTDSAHQTSLIGSIKTDGSDLNVMAEVSAIQLQFPRWSPDGASLATIGSSQGGNSRDRVFVVSADGKNKRFLPSSGSGVGISSVAWISNDELVFLRGDSAEASAYLVRQNIRSGLIRSSTWPRQSVVLDVARPGTMVFDTYPSRSSLREVPLATQAGAAAYHWLARGNSVDRQPQYSPDGKRIVFSSTRSGNIDVWQIEVENGTISRLTDGPGTEYDPGFTPDGKKIIYTSDRSGHDEIYLAEADGSGVSKVTDDGVDAENGTMTKDGQWIVYVSSNPSKTGIWRIHPDGSGGHRIAAGAYSNPEVSPDGEYALYVTSLSASRNVIRMVRIADGAPIPFEIVCSFRKQTPWVMGRARWMPDGRAIAFIGQDGHGVHGVYVQDFVPGKDTSASRRSLGGFDPEMSSETFAISPDGTHMIVSVWEQTSSLMMAERVPAIMSLFTLWH